MPFSILTCGEILLETRTILLICSTMAQTHHLTAVQIHLAMNTSLLRVMPLRPVLLRSMLLRLTLLRLMLPRSVLLRSVLPRLLLLILRNAVTRRTLPIKKRGCT